MFVERVVKFSNDWHPFLFSFGDFVKILFDRRGEFHVHNLRKMLDEKIVHQKSDFERKELALLVFVNVFPVNIVEIVGA